MPDFTDRAGAALVVGATGGIGAAIARRFAAEMGVSFSVSVVFSLPASSHSDTCFRMRCCSSMSCVWKIARVNISSHEKLTLLLISAPSASGSFASTIDTIRPNGLMTATMVSQ